MPRGGKRKGAGRPKTGRRQITVSIRKETLDALGPQPHMKIRQIIEGEKHTQTLGKRAKVI